MIISSYPLNRFSEDIRVAAIIVTELKFSDIQWEIFGTDFVESADNAALHQRPEAFDGLRMDRAANVLACAMVNDAVRELFAEVLVADPFVRAEQAHLVRDAFANEAFERRGAHVRDYASDNIALAANRTRYNRLARTDAAGPVTTAALVPMPIFGEPADERLIDLDNAHEFAEFLIGQSGAHAVAHMPSGTIRAKAHHAVNLKGGNSFLAGQHEMDDAEPLAKGLIRVLENRAGNVGEAVVGCGRRASIAQPIPFHRSVLFNVHIAATRASDALRPTMPDQICATLIFVRECLFPIGEGHLRDGFGLFGAGHSGSPSLDRNPYEPIN